MEINNQSKIFPVYTYHQQQVENIINEILCRAYGGESIFSIDLSGKDDLTENDLQYIKKEVTKRIQ